MKKMQEKIRQLVECKVSRRLAEKTTTIIREKCYKNIRNDIVGEPKRKTMEQIREDLFLKNE